MSENKFLDRTKHIPVVAVLHICKCGSYLVEPLMANQQIRPMLQYQCLRRGCLQLMPSQFITQPELLQFEKEVAQSNRVGEQ